MNQQPTITELIETISQSLEADGITAEYIKQLSYTWNTLPALPLLFLPVKVTTVTILFTYFLFSFLM